VIQADRGIWQNTKKAVLCRHLLRKKYSCLFNMRGRDSSVGIATGYGLDSPGSNPGRGEIFPTRPDRPWGPPSLLYNGYRNFSGDKAAGAWCWPPTPSSTEVMKEYSYTSTLPLGLRGLLQGELYLICLMYVRLAMKDITYWRIKQKTRIITTTNWKVWGLNRHRYGRNAENCLRVLSN
jgi:hypothetical protein